MFNLVSGGEDRRGVMGLMGVPDKSLHAGSWIWWIETNRFLGDGVIADLFDLDRHLLEEGVPIEVVRASVHPDDLQVLIDTVQASIDHHRPYRSTFRVRRRDGLVRDVMAIGQCFYDSDRSLQFVGTTIELPIAVPGPTIDQLTDQVIVACDTARALGETYRLRLLEMVLADIGSTTATSLDMREPQSLPH